MLGEGLLYVADRNDGWLAHFVPARSVLAGFGRLSPHNTRIIQMEDA